MYINTPYTLKGCAPCCMRRVCVLILHNVRGSRRPIYRVQAPMRAAEQMKRSEHEFNEVVIYHVCLGTAMPCMRSCTDALMHTTWCCMRRVLKP